MQLVDNQRFIKNNVKLNVVSPFLNSLYIGCRSITFELHLWKI
jgi:hypothetical protein